MARPVKQVRYGFVDREGNVGTLSFYVPLSLSGSPLLTFINDMGALLDALSDAFIFEAKVIYKAPYSPVGVPAVEADVNARVVLYYSKDGYYEAIAVPSPKATLFEVQGAYQGIRVDPTAEALIPFTSDAPTVLAFLVTPEAEAFATLYVVGGLML